MQMERCENERDANAIVLQACATAGHCDSGHPHNQQDCQTWILLPSGRIAKHSVELRCETDRMRKRAGLSLAFRESMSKKESKRESA